MLRTPTRTRRLPVVKLVLPVLISAVALGACRGGSEEKPADDGAQSFPRALALGLALFEKSPEGKQVPQPATAAFLVREGGSWQYRTLVDEDSNVFHKVMEYAPVPGERGILTLGGTAAIVRLWPKGGEPRTLWEADFGGKFSRMRDGEIADVYGTGESDVVVATHDQGVVAVVRPGEDGFTVEELDRQENTFVHEVEVGDLDGDGTLEIYATPSLPNKLDGTPQPGEVVRYVPAREEGRKVVADLGERHAKEILVDDIDGDGRDELYVAIEAVSGGRVEIRRFEADTPPDAGVKIATLDDKLCRVLVSGDVEGDGRKEIVAAGFKSGLWLLSPGPAPGDPWTVVSIDRDSSGFEHASLLADLDGDGADELYAASDDHHEVRRYVWKAGAPVREVIYAHPEGMSGFTWNITAVSTDLVP
ncbi:MAG: VCBS repeat-containing protein [Acidobacteria bacterium]|nr:VCBS repeat-containing protein [Acidobacteriota bacterium]